MKIKKECGCPGCGLWLKLEAERLGYKSADSKVKVVTKTIKEKIYLSNPKRDKLYFNAGRYAAGARDEIAIKAHEQLMKDLENEK